jgi:hypothetical protein
VSDDEHEHDEGTPRPPRPLAERILHHARREMTGLMVHYEDLIEAINVAESEGYYAGLGRNPDLPRRLRKALREAAHCEGLWSTHSREIARKRGWIP